MTRIKIETICDRIRDTLGVAAVLKARQAPDELTEDVSDCPLLQVYPEEETQDISTSSDRTTFRGGVRQSEIVIHADFYAHRRANIAENYAVLVKGWDQLTAILEEQDSKPYFDLTGIKAFHWSVKRQTFGVTDPRVLYVGARFRIVLRVF